LRGRFLDDGRICLSNHAAERALRGIALGRKSWLFAGSDRGGQRAAAMYSLIVTAKLNNVDKQRRPAGLVGRRPGPDRRSSRPQDRPATAVELAAALGTAKSGSLIVAAIAAVFTIGYAANLLGEDEDWLHELSINMLPEDGLLWVYGVGKHGVTFLHRRRHRELASDHRRRANRRPCAAIGQTCQIVQRLRCSPHGHAASPALTSVSTPSIGGSTSLR
jgi:hypothetical protein